MVVVTGFLCLNPPKHAPPARVEVIALAIVVVAVWNAVGVLAVGAGVAGVAVAGVINIVGVPEVVAVLQAAPLAAGVKRTAPVVQAAQENAAQVVDSEICAIGVLRPNPRKFQNALFLTVPTAFDHLGAARHQAQDAGKGFAA